MAVSALAQSTELDKAAAPAKTSQHPRSPVAFFRELLAMKPEERERVLDQYPPAQRKTQSDKLDEYRILPPEICELRLRYTELRWHLLDLIKLKPNERTERLAEVSAEDRPLVVERLKLWDGWPADVKKQFLEHEEAMSLLLQGGSTVRTPVTLSEGNEKELQRWQSLPEHQRNEMCDRFGQFFNLNEEEKKKALNSLPQSERQQMENSLQGLEGLSAEQRKQRLEALKKFSAMKLEAQRRFLQNAARWKAMSDKDREAWRQAVDKLPPMPPMPPGLETNLPPMPPGIPPLPPMPPSE